MRPLGNLRNQSLAHRIREDVIRLFTPAFVGTKAVFKEITLPLNSHLARRPAFPQSDGLLEGISGRWKRKQGVDVIGHEKKNMREPNESLMAEFDSVEQGAGHFGKG
jgi:hypothetical protein